MSITNEDIKKRIDELSKKHCSEFINDSELNYLQKLYLLDETIIGIEKANEDLHSLISKIKDKYNITESDYDKILNNLKQ